MFKSLTLREHQEFFILRQSRKAVLRLGARSKMFVAIMRKGMLLKHVLANRNGSGKTFFGV